ncbi:MAG: hypothetical protein RJA44_1751, partial [Pseudomonadota bacterium]
SLRMTTVAEGVEEPAQLQMLQAEGCDQLQGYLISRPLPPEQVQAFIRHWKERAAQVGHGLRLGPPPRHEHLGPAAAATPAGTPASAPAGSPAAATAAATAPPTHPLTGHAAVMAALAIVAEDTTADELSLELPSNMPATIPVPPPQAQPPKGSR